MIMVQGSMKLVIECLLTLKSQFAPREGGYTLRKSSSAGSDAMLKWKLLGLGGPEVSSRPYPVIGLPSVERRKSLPDSKFRRVLRSHTMSGTVFLCFYYNTINRAKKCNIVY